MLTLRKKIAEALEGECLDLREISKLFRIKEEKPSIISSILQNLCAQMPDFRTGLL